MSKYTPLHLHSTYSLLDGYGHPKRIAERIEEINSDGCALTEHGNIASAVEFVKAMKDKNKKPILGIEAYISEQHASIKDTTNRKLLHLPILCKNLTGWKNLLQIINESNKKQHFYFKPRLSLEQLSQFTEGLIGFSGHLGSNIAEVALNDGINNAAKLANYFKDIFKGNFYLEIQLFNKKYNNLYEKCGLLIREIAKQTGIPIIATGDAHYQYKSDAEIQRIVLCTNLNTTLEKGKLPDSMMKDFFISDEYYIHSYEEMKAFGHTDEELENTNKILDSVEEYNILSGPLLPKFHESKNDFDYLTELCREGWKNKIVSKLHPNKIEEYVERVKYELAVTKDAGLESYFLILYDILNYARSIGCVVGPGRGSSSGSLVAYLLSITEVEPIKHNLVFERFFNQGRKGSYPDIDTDVSSEHRDKIVEYIKKKYGENRVGQIISFQGIKGSQALKQVFRAYGKISFEEMNRITQNVIAPHKISDELQEMKEKTGESSVVRWCLENTPQHFKDYCTLNGENFEGEYAQEFLTATKLENSKSAQSKHPAGIVIGPNDLSELCPMVFDTKTETQIAGFEMENLESIGLVKLDLLSLTLLDKFSLISKLNPKFKIDFFNLDFDDKETWELISCGKTKGVFQLESKLGQSFSKKLKPESMEHLSALSALLRPGAMESIKEDGKNITEHYILKRHNQEPIEYIHPALKSSLKSTYGELVFQEQTLQLAKDLAGFTLEQADTLRKAVGKKKADLMAKVKKEFIKGIENTKVVPTEIGEQVFEWIEKSQRYQFNASHSVAYGYNSYLSAYAKTHFPLEFFTAYLYYAREHINPQQELYELVNDAKNFDIFVQPPNIKNLNERFELINGKIYFGITDIKHVGESVIETLKENKEHITNWYFFLIKISNNINSRAMESLINAGALDCFKMPRIKMLYEYQLWSGLSTREKAWIDKNNYTSLKIALEAMTIDKPGRNSACSNKNRLEKVKSLINLLNNPPYTLEDKPHQIAANENTLLGVCLTATFLDESKTKYKANCSCQEFKNGFMSNNSYISLATQIDNVRLTTTKKGTDPGKEMCFLQVSDDSGVADSIVVFPEKFEEFRGMLVEGNRVLISGQRSKDKSSLIVENIEQI